MPQEQAMSLRDTVEDSVAKAFATDLDIPANDPQASAPAGDADPGADRNEKEPKLEVVKDSAPQPTPDEQKAKEPEKDKDSGPARAAADDGEDEKPGELDPPARWTKEEREEFYSLPQKAQEVLLKRNRSAEAEITRKFQEVAARGKLYDEIDEVLAPHKEVIEVNGHTPASYLKNVLTVGKFANERPEEFIKWFVTERRINPAEIFGQAAQPRAPQPYQQAPAYQQGQQIDPVTGRIINHVGALQKQLEHVAGYIERSQHEQRARTDAEINREIEAFENATDEHGNSRHPFFNDVEKDMIALIQSKQVSTLEDAYERAVWMNPTTRQKQIENTEQKTRQQALREAQEKAKASTKAASSLRSTGGRAAVPAAGGNLRDIVARSLDATASAGAV